MNHYDTSLHGLVCNQRVTSIVQMSNSDALSVMSYYVRLEEIISRRLACKEHLDKSWTNIPLSNMEFLRMLGDIDDRLSFNIRRTFLDVGCGFGLKCWLAQRHHWETVGIDFCRGYLKLAKEVFKENHSTFKRIDAFNYADYDKHALIYTYQPIREQKKMQQLLSVIEEKMAVGSYLYARVCFKPDFTKMKYLSDCTWLKEQP